MITVRPWLLLAGIAMCLSLAACSSKSAGPTRYAISGTVTYDGKPLPAGDVLLTPDNAKNNSGPGVRILIKDGKFQSEPGNGTVGGPHTVVINGFEGQVPSGPEAVMLPQGKPLFSRHETSVDLPRSSTTQKFDVPAKPMNKGP